MAQRTFRYAILAALLTGVGSIALLKLYTSQKTAVVNYGIVAKRDAWGNKVTINEYDREAEHSMKVKLMASALSRQCDEFIPQVQPVTVDAPRNWLNSDVLSDAWYGSQQRQILNREVTAVLKSRQEQAKDALERVFEAQAAFRVGNGPMLYLTAEQQRKAQAKMAEAIGSFDALKQELMKHTQTYCEHIRDLK